MMRLKQGSPDRFKDHPIQNETVCYWMPVVLKVSIWCRSGVDSLNEFLHETPLDGGANRFQQRSIEKSATMQAGKLGETPPVNSH